MGNHPSGVTLALPNWIAGSLHDSRFCAAYCFDRAYNNDGQSIALTSVNQFSWQSAGFSTALYVEYEVFAHDHRYAPPIWIPKPAFQRHFTVPEHCRIRQTAARTHCARAGAYAKNGRSPHNCQRADATPNTALATILQPTTTRLADRPVRMGRLNMLQFTIYGVSHTVALSGEFDHLNTQRLGKDIQAICAEQLRLFEPNIQHTGQAPFAFIYSWWMSAHRATVDWSTATAPLCYVHARVYRASPDTETRAARRISNFGFGQP